MLDDAIPDVERGDLLAHIGRCTECCAVLDRLAPESAELAGMRPARTALDDRPSLVLQRLLADLKFWYAPFEQPRPSQTGLSDPR